MAASIFAKISPIEIAKHCGMCGAFTGAFVGGIAGGLDGAERAVKVLKEKGVGNTTVRGMLAAGSGIFGAGIGAFGGGVIGGIVGVCMPVTAPIGATALAIHTIHARYLNVPMTADNELSLRNSQDIW